MSKITETGKNLIFLISQPRAGSTLTQKILGCHSQIYTISEPWIMLHPLYALKKQGYKAEYQSDLAFQGLENTLDILPNGQDIYLTGVRKMYSHIYNSLLVATAKEYFLDKTPRYYHIIPELYATFPAAKYIILLRNPLAVLVSILETWIYPQSRDNLQLLRNYLFDLLKAPILMLESIKQLDKEVCIIHYENLLLNPSQEIKVVCDFLQIEFESHVIQYGKQENFSASNLSQKWHFGDQDKVIKEIEPNSTNVNSWIDKLSNPYTWQLVNDYLQFLGEEIIEKMGYSYSFLENSIQEKKSQDLECKPKLSQILPELEIFEKWKYNSTIFSNQNKEQLMVEKSLAKDLMGSKKNVIELNNLINHQKNIIEYHKKNIKELYSVIENKDLYIRKTEELLYNERKQSGQTQAQLGQTQAQLGQTQTQLGQTQAQLEQTQAQLEQTSRESAGKLVELTHQIKEMENSKFWQIRNKWFELKKYLKLHN